ncbi:MAG: hypothetical protein EBY16_10915, partial [Gammaproteobacteria bacterium]|nr:hypothetical protein [Gammaproteobacteria bacterium]
ADSVRVLTFEDVLDELKITRGETPVDFEYFGAWCETRKQHPDKGVKKTFKAALQADESLLWQEFEYVLMQTPDWRKPSTAHLSLDEYYGLGEAQSRVSQDQRATIYRSVFAPFLEDIATNPKLYYPPLEAYKLYQQALPSGLQVDALVLDEVQKVHPWVSTCFLKLLKQPLKAGNFFICGDAHQGAECQQLRVSETLTNYLVGQEADVLIGHLLVNYRSSQAVTRLVLQTHAIEMALLGSMEKTTHLHPKVNCDAPEGSVMVMDYDANIKQKIQLDAEAYVLIPNESCREAAVQRWPAGQVVTLSEFAGLSGETIVMYGFGDYFQKDIGDIGALFADVPLPSWDTQSAFARRGIDYAQRTCLQSIYTAA